MNNDSHQTREQLLGEVARLRNEVALLKSTKYDAGKTTHLLRKSMQELADLKRALDESTFFNITNREGKIIYANQKFCRLSGYSKEELFGQTHRIVKSDYHPQEFFKQLWTTITEGQTWRGEIRNKTKDGRYYWVDTTIVPLLDDEGRPKYFLGIRSDVTKQKVIESQLEGQQDISRKFMDVAGGIFVFTDTDQTVCMINRKGSELLDYSVDEVVGKNWYEAFIPADIRDEVKRTFSALMNGKVNEIEYFESPVATRSGQRKEIVWHITTLRNNSNQIIGILSSGIDITDRKQAEIELQKSEARYRSVVEDQAEFIIRWSRDEKLTYVNESYCRYFGKNRDELIGTDYIPRIPKEDQKIVQEHLNSLHAGNPVSTCEHRVILPKGTIGWTHWSSRAIFNHQNELIEIQSVGRDISDSKNAEHELQKSEERFRSLIATAGSIIIHLSPGFQILEWNYEAERVFGWKRDEVIGDNYFSVCYDGSDYESIANDLKSICPGEPIRGLEVRIVTRDGVSRHLVWNFSRLYDGESQPGGIIVIGEDITERRQAEEELNKTRKDLMVQTLNTQRLSALATMAGGIAHELNQPLSSIRVYAETISNFIRNNDQNYIDKIPNILEKIINQVDRTSIIIDHMREFASEKSDRPSQMVYISDVVDSVATLLAQQLRNHGIRFINETDVNHKLMMNKTRLEHVLINLISNAKDGIEEKKFSPDEEKEIRITSVANQESVILRVHDTGGGVREDVQQHLLDPFVTTKGPNRGMGLGLSICHGILKEHNATIELEETSNKGTVFKLEFPQTYNE